MAAVDFPDSPIPGDLFVNPNNGGTYVYTSSGNWDQLGSPFSNPPQTPEGNYAVVYSGPEPTNPLPGVIWFPSGPGTYGLGYIWTGAAWNLINGGRTPFGPQADRPLNPTLGTIFYNTDINAHEYWNGSIWLKVVVVSAADVTFASNTGLVSTNVQDAIDELDTKVATISTSLVYGGTYDASTNTVASVTQGGTDNGLIVGQPVPTAAANVYVIVSVAGTGVSPVPTQALEVGSWLVNNGSTWDLVQLGEPNTSAAKVSFNATGGIASTDVQAALTELDSEKADKTVTVTAVNGLEGGGDLSSNFTVGLADTAVTSGSYGGTDKTISINVDNKGRLQSASAQNIQDASLTQKGIVQLNDATNSFSVSEAATPNAVRNTREAAADAQTSADNAQTAADNAQTAADAGAAAVGNLSGLATDNKTTIVGAINEVQTETNTAGTNAQQALTDAALAQQSADSKLPLTGGVMTGEITSRNINVQAGYSVRFDNGAGGIIDSISDSVTSNSPTDAASSLAAKTAYDAGIQGQADAAAVDTKVGTLTNLSTTDKTNTVNAINELDGRIDTLGNSLIYGGTYNAAGNVVASVTQAGIDAGFTAGQPLVTGPLTENVFVIVTTSGTGTAPAPLLPLSVGNWLIGNGTSYDLLQLGTPSTTADLVAFSPTLEVSANNVQDAIDEVGSEKVDKTRQIIAGTGLTGGGNLTTDRTLALDNSGVTPGVYGNDGQIPQVQVDTYGRITNISEISATLDGLSDVNAAAPTGGQVLQYNAVTGWESATLTTTGVSNAEVNATESNFLYVDAGNGNDGTGTPGDITKPYATIGAALAAAVAPNMIIVGEGTYNEANPLIVPAGIQIISKCGTLGWVHSRVIPNNITDDVFVLTGGEAGICGLSIDVPQTSGKAAIRYTGGNGTTGSVTFCAFFGAPGYLGDGLTVSSTGTGKIISFEIRYRGGDMGYVMMVEGGILATESVHVPNTPLGGAPFHVFGNFDNIGSPISRLQGLNTNSGNSGISHIIDISGGTTVMFGVNWFNAGNGIHIKSNDYDMEINGGNIDCTLSLIVDPGLTGANGRLYVNAAMNDAFDYPSTWQGSDYSFEYSTKLSDENTKRTTKRLRGTDFAIGEAPRGQSLTVGRGGPTKRKMRVLTSDSTADPTTDGGNIIDVTAAALSKDSSSFTWQANTAGCALYFGTEELDESGFPLRHTGLDLDVSSPASIDGVYLFEIWDGVTWVVIGSQSVDDGQGFSYGTSHFWRVNEETIFYGIRPQTTWATKTINGITTYWARIRIATPPTTLPSFETVYLLPSAAYTISAEGQLSSLGGAQSAVITSQGSNIFSESGNVTNYIFTMGDGGNAYTHRINNVLIDQTGEGLYWQTSLTPGICTALPIFIEVGYSLNVSTTTTAPEFNVYFQPIRTSGTLVADPGGSTIPIQRPESQTTPYTGTGAENPTLVAASPLPYVEANKLHRVRFGPFNVQDFYEGDALAIFLEANTLGTPTSDINVWGVAIIGYQWTPGIRGY